MDGVDSYFDKFCILTKTVKWQNILEGMFQLCRPTNMWSRWNFKRNKTYRVSADHGYTGGTLVTYASGTKTVKEIEEERKEAYLNNKYKWIADYNQEALVEFFRITQKNDIDVILYKSPIMQAEDAAVINNIFSIGKSYNNVKMCWDACCSMEKIGLSIDDFYDSLHLNKRGGEKFTYYFGNLFSESFDEDVDWNNVFAYRGESVRQLPDKSFEYSMDNYSKDTLYKFELYNKNDVIDSTDYSEKNSYICDIDVRESEEYSLYCYMISKKSFNEERYAENIKNKFMKQNKCVIK
ncbi:MAG: hypothetical protein HFE62_01550 [Firmicutes bacterium]|nr:hypothetical protein [Bacillota bacterium]